MRYVQLVIILFCTAFLLTSCGGKDKALQTEEGRPVEEIYNEAADALDKGEYEKATRLFEDVERQYPYSEWATRAELMAAYSSYKALNYEESILALDRFVSLHPGSPEVDYALYLKALSYYERISDVARDQAMTKDALESFNTLIQRFPDSRYARDARLKRDLTLDHLAGKEMEIGRYYLRRGQINAAINRFRTVLMLFQTTTHVPEALHRLVECYMTLGLEGEATRIAAVLGHNYPGSRWYEDSYNLLDPEQRKEILEDRNWIDRTVDSLFTPD